MSIIIILFSKDFPSNPLTMVEKTPKIKPNFDQSYIDFQKSQKFDEGFRAAKKAHKEAKRAREDSWQTGVQAAQDAHR